MRKIFHVFAFVVLAVFNVSAQNTDYFGSVVIPKNDYAIKFPGNNRYWSVDKEKKDAEIELKPSIDKELQKVQFIPAGNGYYFIKFVCSGDYLTMNATSKKLYSKTAERLNDQKFKVVKTTHGKFMFVSFNQQFIEMISQVKEHKPNTVTANSLNSADGIKKLRVTQKKGGNQIFEIIDFKSGKIWSD